MTSQLRQGQCSLPSALATHPCLTLGLEGHGEFAIQKDFAVFGGPNVNSPTASTYGNRLDLNGFVRHA